MRKGRCSFEMMHAGLPVGDIKLVHGIELELDLFPRFHGDLQFRAVLGGGGKNILPVHDLRYAP